MDDTYLGDGVYASFDGHSITLDLRGKDNTTKIVLEPEVFNSLLEYKKRIVRERERGRSNVARSD